MKWRDATKEKPEPDTYVLTWGGGWDEVQKMHYTRHHGADFWDQRSAETHYVLKHDPVTHWMPIPEGDIIPLAYVEKMAYSWAIEGWG